MPTNIRMDAVADQSIGFQEFRSRCCPITTELGIFGGILTTAAATARAAGYKGNARVRGPYAVEGVSGRAGYRNDLPSGNWSIGTSGDGRFSRDMPDLTGNSARASNDFAISAYAPGA